MEVVPRRGFHRLPALKHLRQQIHHAPETLQLTHLRDIGYSGSVCRVEALWNKAGDLLEN